MDFTLMIELRHIVRNILGHLLEMICIGLLCVLMVEMYFTLFVMLDADYYEFSAL